MTKQFVGESSTRSQKSNPHCKCMSSFRVLTPNDYNKDINYGHGRIKTRKCSILIGLSLVEDSEKWPGLTSIVRIKRTRHFKVIGKVEFQTNYYTSSIDNAKVIQNGVRKHWGIENKVHWILDVAFLEKMLLRTFHLSIELPSIF